MTTPHLTWQESGDVRWFAGGHFFINQERTVVLDYISAELSKLQTVRTSVRLECPA